MALGVPGDAIAGREVLAPVGRDVPAGTVPVRVVPVALGVPAVSAAVPVALGVPAVPEPRRVREVSPGEVRPVVAVVAVAPHKVPSADQAAGHPKDASPAGPSVLNSIRCGPQRSAGFGSYEVRARRSVCPGEPR